MYAQYYYIRLIVLALSVALDLYSAGLWSFAYIRTALPFCLVLVVTSVGALLVTLVAAAFAYDLAGIKRFDPGNIIYGFSFFLLQPLVTLLTAAGQTWLVIWLIRNRRGSNQSLQPTAGRRDDQI